MNIPELYKKIMQQAPLGYACHRIICNEEGSPIDYEFLEVNMSFQTFTGLESEKIIGKRISEVLPEILKDSFDWIGFYGKIALGGEKQNFESYSEALGKWYKVDAFSPEKGYFVTLFSDITPLKKHAEKLEASERRYRGFIHHAPFCVMVADVETKEIIYSNPMMLEMFGYEEAEVVGMKVHEFHPEPYRKLALQELQEIIQGNKTQTVDLPCRRKDGSEFIASISAMSTEIDDKIRVVGFVLDITERRNTEEALKRQLASEKLISEISSSLVSVSSGNLGKKVNRALRLMGDFFNVDRAYIFQFAENELSMKNTFEWCAPGIDSQKDVLQDILIEQFPWWEKQLRVTGIISVEDRDNMPADAAMEQQFLAEHDTLSVLCLPMMRNKEVTGFIGFDSVQHTRDWSSEEISVLGILNNIISDSFNRYRSDEDILYLSYHDKLTGLYNRRFFEEELKRMDTERQLPLSVIIGDVNGLKITNDVFGHMAGDRLLKMIAKIVSESCRDDDVVARWGGDEFVVLLPKTSSESAGMICKRIYLDCEAAKFYPVHASISLGHATKTHMNQSIEQVINSAEDWMYRRKLMESRNFRSSMVSSLISTLSEKSFETVGHTERMGKMSQQMGKAMGLSEEEIESLSLLAMLHDIGKVVIPEDILTKPGKLTEDERIEIKRHSEIGYRIAQSTSELSQLAELILCIHERWDGTGYPNHLKGEEIPKLSRIVAVIDAYDVMTHERPYREAVSHEQAVNEIEACAGTQFDPRVVDVFLEFMKENNQVRKNRRQHIR